MASSLVKRDPEDASRLGLVPATESEALDHALFVVQEWEPASEVWALRYAPAAPVVLSALPALLMTDRIRNLNGLVGIGGGRMIAGAPAAIIPAAMAAFNQYYAQNDLLLAKTKVCDVLSRLKNALCSTRFFFASGTD